MRRDSQARVPGMTRHAWYLSVLLGCAAAAVALSWRSPVARFDMTLAVGLAVAFFATRLLTIRLPQGDDVYVTLVVALGALAIADIAVILVAFVAACIVELIARFSSVSKSAARARALDAVRAAAVLGLIAPWQLVLRPLVDASAGGDIIIAWVVVAGMTYAGIDILTMAIQQRIAGGLSVVQGVLALQRPLVTMYLVHIAMGAVAVRLYAESGLWAFPIALLLTLILQNSFNLYLRIRRGYADTISALAHAAELDRPHDSGHARRVADLAVAVGRRMGLSSRDLERIGYAALLHDIGRMGELAEDTSGAHAQRGAEIVASIPFLADVAPLVDRPLDSDEVHPIGAEIVRLCSRYDRLRAEVGASAALETLGEEAGAQEDDVLRVLGEVITDSRSRLGVSR